MYKVPDVLLTTRCFAHGAEIELNVNPQHVDKSVPVNIQESFARVRGIEGE